MKWRLAWYERNPEGLVGRLRKLARTRPEAAYAMARRLEREGWGPWWELLGDLKAPRSLCPECGGEGLVWTHPLAKSWEVPEDLADDWWMDCGYCGGEGLVPLASLSEEEEGYAEDEDGLAC